MPFVSKRTSCRARQGIFALGFNFTNSWKLETGMQPAMTDALSNAPEQSTRTNTNATARRTKEGTEGKESGRKEKRRQAVRSSCARTSSLFPLFLLVVRIALLS